MNEREIFLAALEIKDATGRHRYLLEQLPDDPLTRDRVLELLQAAVKAGDFLEKPALDPYVTEMFTGQK